MYAAWRINLTHPKARSPFQKKYAELAGLHHNLVDEVERGEKTISIDSLFRVAKALGVPLWKLVQKI